MGAAAQRSHRRHARRHRAAPASGGHLDGARDPRRARAGEGDRAMSKVHVSATVNGEHAEILEKVTGRAQCGDHIHLPGMLHGKALRSPHAHARIRHIDAERARALPGVRAVITDADFSQVRIDTVQLGEAGIVDMHDLPYPVELRLKNVMQAGNRLLLDIAAGDVQPAVGDTDAVGYSFPLVGSRTTFATGIAVIEAAQKVIAQMTERAALLWQTEAANIDFRAGQFVDRTDAGRRFSFRELGGRLPETGGQVSGQATVTPEGVGFQGAGSVQPRVASSPLVSLAPMLSGIRHEQERRQ
ncbi:MAG: xanthine dehydrogenase family protein [Gammaproteobacteria bacterium]|nr:xanthine dehydrogenase family protein [Gammaproteobacteria bacterium]